MEDSSRCQFTSPEGSIAPAPPAAAASHRTWIPSSRHVSGPRLVVLDITAADEETALAPMGGLQQLWVISGTTAIRRGPAQPGARARVHADIRRTNPGCPVHGCVAGRGGGRALRPTRHSNSIRLGMLKLWLTQPSRSTWKRGTGSPPSPPLADRPSRGISPPWR
ncbi:DUF6207 family protein [Streptomyces anulatus]|uniref:DUF6207 family protein n=1 Tax=Streptomyces anulatus TaxID=1892 RepID=UPI003248FF4B|nr:DUF6207 family protein [Streptomyces anulatus]